MTITHIEWSELRSTGYQNARATLSATIGEADSVAECFKLLAGHAKEQLDLHAPKPLEKKKSDKPQKDAQSPAHIESALECVVVYDGETPTP